VSDHSAPHAVKTGVVLINTGSSSAPKTKETRVYLRQFLSDPRIIDIPAWKRWIIVNCFILPFRPKQTAHAYAAIWTERGSPLIAISEDFRDALRQRFPETPFEIGMAYGEPSIPSALDKLREQGVDRILIVPMFPQYASATTGSVLTACYEHATKQWNVPHYAVMPPYYREPSYIDAWEAIARPALEEFRPDHVLLSYHGLPERQIYKADETGRYCLQQKDCCEKAVPENRWCYRHHCIQSSKALIERLGLEEGRYSITFQSRLGRDPWLEPATDNTIERLAKDGVKRLAILSPAFTADCLETLEELGMAGKESFIEHGGEDLMLVPSLNTHPVWVDAMCGMIARELRATE